MGIQFRSFILIGTLLLASYSADASPTDPDRSLIDIAEQYFRGVYGCNAGVVDELASDDIVVSYPIFQTLFGQPALRGRDAVKSFAERFCSKWVDAEFFFDEAIADRNRVVLVWSFSARPAESEPGGPRQSWGGISLFRFGLSGRITEEVGEESEPGPLRRLERSRSK